jgi:thiamine kinase-like enzyme
MSEERSPFSAESAHRALTTAAEKVGVDPRSAELIRMGENAIFALRGEGVVARIARSLDLWEGVERELAVARWLRAHDFPAVRVAEQYEQPVAADGRLITFWELVDISGDANHTDLAGLLRDLHALPDPEFHIPAFAPFSVVPARLADPGNAEATAVAFLADLYEDLKGKLVELEFGEPLGLIHGDAHCGNIIPTKCGPLLSDFEVVAWGPREWDLTPTAVS